MRPQGQAPYINLPTLCMYSIEKTHAVPTTHLTFKIGLCTLALGGIANEIVALFFIPIVSLNVEISKMLM